MSQEKIILLVKGLVVCFALVGYKTLLLTAYHKQHKHNVMKTRHKNNLDKGGDK